MYFMISIFHLKIYICRKEKLERENENALYVVTLVITTTLVVPYPKRKPSTKASSI